MRILSPDSLEIESSLQDGIVTNTIAVKPSLTAEIFDDGTTCCMNDISLGENATLKHYKFQDTNDAFTQTTVKQQSGSSYYYFLMQRSGQDEILINLEAENAKAKVMAAYKTEKNNSVRFSTTINHLQPSTLSEQLVKGVADDDSKGVFDGKIHIAKHAVKTEGHLLHKAILLGETAEAYAKPELNIFADDVKCSHGVAIGQLDKNQLFYMQSRGIAFDEARQMLVDAYLDEIIETIDNPEIKEWMKAHV